MSPVVAILILLVLFLLHLWVRSHSEPVLSIKQAESGDVEAQKRLALMYLKGDRVKQDYNKGVEWLEQAAKQGDAEAQVELGAIYYFGKGISPDAKAQFLSYVKSFKWYQKAAAKGHGEAQRRVADMYYEGQGVDQNFAKAYSWYAKAVAKSDIMARYKLGLLYQEGHGVEQDLVTAYMWLYLAYNHAQNYGSMQETMTSAAYALKEHLTAPEVQQAEMRAAQWLTDGMPEPPSDALDSEMPRVFEGAAMVGGV